MGISKNMTGSPWHVEKMTRKENDPKRHRSRCIFYDSSTKYCSCWSEKCKGSAHCSEYKEAVTHSQTKVHQPEPKISLEFEGVKEIPINLVKVRSNKAYTPNKSKVNNLIKYYKQNGKLDPPIIVRIKNDKYFLADKYLSYYVAKELGLKTIPARIGTFKESRVEDTLRKVGTKVTNQKHGNGVVIKADASYTTIRFDDSEEITYEISLCVKRKTLTIGWK